MKRLKQKILDMDEKTKTYKEMYEGRMLVYPIGPGRLPYEDFDNTYYREEVAYRIERTHKLALDKPTVTIAIPAEFLGIKEATTAGADFCLREFLPYIEALNEPLYNRNRPDSEKGKYYCYQPGGEVLVRNAVFFKVCTRQDYIYSGGAAHLIPPEEAGKPRLCLCLRIQVQLPEKRIRKTCQMLTKDLPKTVDSYIAHFNREGYLAALELENLQKEIREWLKDSEYCAFLANGSILPRGGNSDLPKENAIPFISVPEDEITVCGIRGMGIRRGVTVITGGGYSGKSTLLEAVAAGIYDHVAGDGRELCITDVTAMGISGEDGRSVKNVNIAPFIRWIPGGDTAHFSTERASGSTSQAANIMEAVSMGSRLLLIDEDRSATNFMIRDSLMRELVKKEPITPFTERVRELYEACGVSTVLVIGGSGEYLSVADRVYLMEDYRIFDVTKQAGELCKERRKERSFVPADWKQERVLSTAGFSSFVPELGMERLTVTDMGVIYLGEEALDIRMLTGLITQAQKNAVGFLMRYMEVLQNGVDILGRVETAQSGRKLDLRAVLDELYVKIEEEGLDCVFSNYFTTCERFLDLPRKEEVLAAICRMRHVTFL
ncbi:MAG: hypothetical protein J1E35_10595 [Lachnospiraceae bacterium]|nr:hypothetical protein [Lachnospiraceae bacterium]